MILVPDPIGSSRCTVRTAKSPASMTSVNSSPGTISVSRIVTGSSSPGAVMVNVVPTSNGPLTSSAAMPAFQVGQAAMSDQCRHTAAGLAAVSTLCSYSHMVPPVAGMCVDYLCADYLSRGRWWQWLGEAGGSWCHRGETSSSLASNSSVTSATEAEVRDGRLAATGVLAGLRGGGRCGG